MQRLIRRIWARVGGRLGGSSGELGGKEDKSYSRVGKSDPKVGHLRAGSRRRPAWRNTSESLT